MGPKPIRYFDKGNLATIGRGSAVADIKGLRLSGSLAWLTWLAVHRFHLFRLRQSGGRVLQLSVSFSIHGRGVRLITAQATESPSEHRTD